MHLSHRRRRSLKQRFHFTATTTAPSQLVSITRLTVNTPTVIDWGDGSSETLPANSSSAVTHTYSVAGTYQITVGNARYITHIKFDNAVFGNINTSELRKSLITYFWFNYVTKSVINSSDMVNWPLTYFHLSSMPSSGTYNISTSHLVNANISNFILYGFSVGNFNINSADMVGWNNTNDFQMYNLPSSGTYIINSEHMVSWRPKYFAISSMPNGSYNISTSHMVNWNVIIFYTASLPTVTYDFSSPCFRYWTSLRDLRLHSLNLTQEQVDTVLYDLYAGRMGYTYATPVASLGGTNADPSGVYQAMVPPTSGLEAKYDLVNDPASEGFKKWSITT